jgi:hypothetical protein
VYFYHSTYICIYIYIYISSFLCLLSIADGTTNNLNEYIAMSMDDVMDRESMVNDVYFNKHGVVVNEMVLPKFFSGLPGRHS